MWTQAIERGGLAVITGAAGGIGLAAATRLAEQGMGVVLADLPGDTLDRAAHVVTAAARGRAPVLAVPTDVTRPDSVAALAEAAFAAGEVAIVMANAGIGRRSGAWTGLDAWRAILEVNLFGVVHVVHAFVPGLIAAARPAAVVITGSKQGITTPPGNPAYNASKAGVKVVAEQLAHELREQGAPIGVHLFVPGWTFTGMTGGGGTAEKPAGAWTAAETVDHFMARAAAGDFYILCPDGAVTPAVDRRRVRWAAEDIILGRPALSRWHPDYRENFAAFERDET